MSEPKSKGKLKSPWIKVVLTGIVVLGAFGIAKQADRLNWQELRTIFSGMSMSWFAIALVVSTIQCFGQILRLWVIFKKAERPKSWPLVYHTAVGTVLNTYTPLRSGDAYKVIQLGTIAPAAIVLAGVLAERIADAVSMFMCGAWASSSEVMRYGRKFVTAIPFLKVGVVIGALGLVALVFYWVKPPHLVRKVWGVIRGFFRRMDALFRSPQFFICLLVGVLAWIIDGYTVYFSARALGTKLTLAQCVNANFVLNIGLAIPLTVANVGIFEASMGFALVAFGLSAAQALGVATVSHVAKLFGPIFCLALLWIGKAMLGNTLKPGVVRALGSRLGLLRKAG